MKDYTGIRKGKLTALRFSRRTNLITYWIVKCDCGKEKEIRACLLVGNQVNSCGCSRKKQRIKDSSERALFREYRKSSKNERKTYKKYGKTYKNIS